MRHEELPVYWKEKIAEYIKNKYNEDRKRLGATDFHDRVKIDFPDRSRVYFEYAFYIIDDEKNEVAVFTEHCGYHIFPFYDDTIIELLKSVEDE